MNITGYTITFFFIQIRALLKMILKRQAFLTSKNVKTKTRTEENLQKETAKISSHM